MAFKTNIKMVVELQFKQILDHFPTTPIHATSHPKHPDVTQVERLAPRPTQALFLNAIVLSVNLLPSHAGTRSKTHTKALET